MKAPGFWNRPPDRPGALAKALAPLAMLYAWGTRWRLAGGVRFRADVPVICVGNINIGGTGKTPVVIALAERLKRWGYRPAVVSRGYGGRIAGPTQVLEQVHTARDVGDEPLLLAAFAPTWVSRDRAAGVLAAQVAGADVVILDDGFQNPSVAQDLAIVVVDASVGFGNGRVIPAGPLREPVDVGLARCDLVVSIGPQLAQTTFLDTWSSHLSCPNVGGALRPLETGMEWSGLRVLAFAGIGNPAKFFATLLDLGAILVRTVPLADHQPLNHALLLRLQADAKAANAQLVTTEKDAVRLPDGFRQDVLTVPVRLELDDWGSLDAALAKIGISPSSKQP